MQQRQSSLRPPRSSRPLLALLVIGLALLCGCLQEPGIDERWTLMEVMASSPAPGDGLAARDTLRVRMTGRVTYRAIRTGFLVAEARYSDTLGPDNIFLDPEDHSLRTARKIEQILANSVTAGRGTRAVTGFDHLMQTVDFDFSAVVPGELFTATPTGQATRGMFLVLYLGEGEEMEIEGRRDSLVVTPLPAEEDELLFTGFALDWSGSGTTP